MRNSEITIAATSTFAMVCAAERAGVDATDLLQQHGLTRASIEDPDARIPARAVFTIWNALRERTGNTTLQLIAPTCLPFGAYRIIDYVVAASGTVGEGVERFARFFKLIAHVSLRIETDEGVHCLDLAMSDGTAVPPVYVDYVFAALTGRIRMRIKRDLGVHRVELRQRQPDQATASCYEEVFRSEVRFGARRDRLCFSDGEWCAPTESADAALAALMEEHARIIEKRIPQAGSTFLAEVQHAIASAPPEAASAADIARTLHVSLRTLQRRLSENGSTFRDVAEAVHSQLAQEYLAAPKNSIAEVAFLLGFGDQASFTRAFRRWTGESPGRWRRQRGT